MPLADVRDAPEGMTQRAMAIRWPGVAFTLPPPERYGLVAAMPPDFLFRDYAPDAIAAARTAGEQAGRERSRWLLDRLGDVRVTAGPAGVTFGADTGSDE